MSELGITVSLRRTKTNPLDYFPTQRKENAVPIETIMGSRHERINRVRNRTPLMTNPIQSTPIQSRRQMKLLFAGEIKGRTAAHAHLSPGITTIQVGYSNRPGRRPRTSCVRPPRPTEIESSLPPPSRTTAVEGAARRRRRRRTSELLVEANKSDRSRLKPTSFSRVSC